MILRKNEENAIHSLKERLKNRYSLLDFRIFGSKSRGDDSVYSDIDVMIELEESNYLIESDIYDLAFDINLENDCLLSLTIFSRKELDEGPLSESPIYKTIMKEGVFI
jgi:predicted nucleotidyltransferase